MITMNWSQISAETLLGKLIRLPFRVVPEGSVVHILRGPARGIRWISNSSTRGFWLGLWEPDNLKLFASHLALGSVVYDIGAHVGLYTLLSSKRVGSQGHVYSFEPLPRNVQYLRRHIELNEVSNCTVVEVAVSDRAGYGHFDPTAHDSAAHLSPTGAVEVAMIALDDFFYSGSGARPPNAMKINAEGAETEVLLGGRRLIQEFFPVIFLSLHTEQATQECKEFLSSCGYSIQFLAADKIWAQKTPQ
jgi:FkbM family methyltransferase